MAFDPLELRFYPLSRTPETPLLVERTYRFHRGRLATFLGSLGITNETMEGIYGYSRRSPKEILKSEIELTTAETWLSVVLEGGQWVAAFRLMPQGQQIVAGELRVYPNSVHLPAGDGEWTEAQVFGDKAWVPPGGISTTLLRSIHVDDVKADVRRRIHLLGEVMEEAVNKLRQRDPTTLSPGERFELQAFETHRDRFFGPGQPATRLLEAKAKSRRGRKPWPDDDYLRVATVYVQAHKLGRHPTKAVMLDMGLTKAQATDAVYRAREKDFLSASGGHGKRGDVGFGPKAIEMLEARRPAVSPLDLGEPAGNVRPRRAKGPKGARRSGSGTRCR